MEKEYIIQRVSESVEPYTFEAKYGKKTKYKVEVKDKQNVNSDFTMVVDELVLPAENPKPVTGDIVRGQIKDSEYNGKVKKVLWAKTGNKSSFKSNYIPRDDAAIQCQWAIGQAVTVYMNPLSKVDDPKTTADLLKGVESLAKEFYAMIDQVRASKPINGDINNDGKPVDSEGREIPF